MALLITAARVKKMLAISLVVGVISGMGRVLSAPATSGGQTGAAATRSPAMLAFTHATIADLKAGALQPNVTVLVRGDRIAVVAPDGRVDIPGGATTVDARGQVLIPGLWDAHAHLSNAGVCSLKQSIAHGITAVRDLGGPPAEGLAWRQDITAGRMIGPRLFLAGLNIESSAWMERAKQFFAVSVPAGKNYPIWDWSPRFVMNGPQDAVAAVDSAAQFDVVKFRNLGAEAFRALATQTRRRARRLVGHAPLGIGLADAAEAGLRSLEHGQNLAVAMGSLSAATREQQYGRIARSGMSITPTLVSDGMWAPTDLVRRVIADSEGRIDPRRRHVSAQQLTIWEAMLIGREEPNRETYERAFGEEIAVVREAHRAGVVLLAGTDLGTVLTYPGSSLHEELELLVARVGLSPLEALRTATLNPARFFGLEREMGEIKAGMVADLVLLRRDPLRDIRAARDIQSVIAAGRYFDSNALASLRECGDVRSPK